MAHDRRQIKQLARTYTAAWCGHDVSRIADHYAAGERLFQRTRAGRNRRGRELLRCCFPDGEVVTDDLVFKEDTAEWQSRVTGTSAERGKGARISGFEEWRIDPDGLIAESERRYDEAEYERQLQHDISPEARATSGDIREH